MKKHTFEKVKLSLVNRVLSLKLVLFFSLYSQAEAQDLYWVPQSEIDTTSRRYQAVIYCSEWLDQCVLQIQDKPELAEYTSTIPVAKYELKQTDLPSKQLYSFALEQIEGKLLLDKQLTGKNVKIGIIDGGFMKADSTASLAHFFKYDQVRFYQDFVTPELPPYEGSLALDDVHGTDVWQMIGGYDSAKNIRYGLATDAQYYLARTDHGGFEKRLEEYLLIDALEKMHEMGVRLVNISLGYSKEYTDPSENYRPEQMDGKTTMLTRAIDTAFFAKGMIPVVAAGNEGSDPKWRVLNSPADARGAIAVGATKFKIWEKIDYSSIGTPGLTYVKPNISCFATQGTSFATPVITGMIASILQYNPDFTTTEVIDIIQRAGHLYPYGNNYVGYGVPKASRLLRILAGEQLEKPPVKMQSGRKSKLEIPDEINYVVVLHKVGHEVREREVKRPKGTKIKIKKPKDVTASTVLLGNDSVEIIWQ
jgi:hypothetical protein